MISRENKRILVFIIILSVVASTIWIVNYKVHFNGFFWNDSTDYNQIARNIYEGKGFSTSTLRPVSFLHFQKLPHPEVLRPPLYPYLLAGVFWIFGVGDFAAAICNGFFYIALIIFTYLVAIELSGSYRIAFFAVAVTALLRIFLYVSIIGSSDIVYASLFMVFLFFCLKKPDMVFLQGICIGVLYLFRVNTVFWVLPWLFTKFSLREFVTKKSELLKFFLGVSIFVLPYLIRNYFITGNPLFSLHKYSLMLESREYPGWTFWVQINDLSAYKFLIEHFNDILYKTLAFSKLIYRGFTDIFHPVVILILLSTFIFSLGKDDRTDKIKKFILFALVLQTLTILPFGHDVRFYLYLFPIIFILFGIMIKERLKNIRLKNEILTFIVIVMAAIMLYSSISYWGRDNKININYDIGKQLQAITMPNDVIASDIAWEINWYANRKTVWLPYDIETMNKISSSIPIDYIFLSVKLSRPLAVYKDNLWQKLLFNPKAGMIPNFKLEKIFYYGNYPVGILYKIERSKTKFL